MAELLKRRRRMMQAEWADGAAYRLTIWTSEYSVKNRAAEAGAWYGRMQAERRGQGEKR